MSSGVATLNDLEAVLRRGGYTTAHRDLADRDALLGETPYALVACVEAETWEGLTQSVSDIQAALTRLSDEAPSPRRWDLYLLVHVRMRAPSPVEEALAEEIEADTRYVRKFVRVALTDEEPVLDRALRPLLPLRPAAHFDVSDPLDALREEMLSHDLPGTVADSAIQSFRRGEEITIE